MKLADLLKDKLMGMYIEVVRNGEVLRSIYNGMENKAFLIETDEELKEGDEVLLRLSFGGWNFTFPCKVSSGASGVYVLVPSGKVKITEKRREKRVPTVLECKLGDSKGTILDLSYHGTRILTLNRVDIGSKMSLEVGEKKLTGTVRWNRREEVDLNSIGLLIDEPPSWWEDLVKYHISSYIRALRRL